MHNSEFNSCLFAKTNDVEIPSSKESQSKGQSPQLFQGEKYWSKVNMRQLQTQRRFMRLNYTDWWL